ncbi:diaminopimelate epimerase [Qipengyuania sp.]|uniref:diaminopimelate epimerase n=1 Tax=Qipengyuania sp. TaxID=2004515 RepID=UPI0035C84574
MRVPFIKMHGLGNDFVVLDARAQSLPALDPQVVRNLSDRHEGIGCDQLILLEPTQDAGADVGMRIFNQDGGEVGACGNASRAVASLLGEPARVATGGGIISVRPEEAGATVDMGMPRFDWQEIPLAYAMDTSAMPVGWEDLETPAAVNVGNPHVVFFVSDCDAVDLARIGPVIETDPLFPERINVNIATVTEHGAIRLRVWERGAGITRACGTGACATAVAAMRRGLVSRSVEVALPGGTLTIAWDGETGIKMSGPATESFRGEFEWGQYA